MERFAPVLKLSPSGRPWRPFFLPDPVPGSPWRPSPAPLRPSSWPGSSRRAADGPRKIPPVLWQVLFIARVTREERQHLHFPPAPCCRISPVRSCHISPDQFPFPPIWSRYKLPIPNKTYRYLYMRYRTYRNDIDLSKNCNCQYSNSNGEKKERYKKERKTADPGRRFTV